LKTEFFEIAYNETNGLFSTSKIYQFVSPVAVSLHLPYFICLGLLEIRLKIDRVLQ